MKARTALNPPPAGDVYWLWGDGQRPLGGIAGMRHAGCRCGSREQCCYLCPRVSTWICT